jgi:hypothetical protein
MKWEKRKEIARAGCDDSAQAFLRIGPQTLAKCYV